MGRADMGHERGKVLKLLMLVAGADSRVVVHRRELMSMRMRVCMLHIFMVIMVGVIRAAIRAVIRMVDLGEVVEGTLVVVGLEAEVVVDSGAEVLTRASFNGGTTG
jgi:hypothetical protein